MLNELEVFSLNFYQKIVSRNAQIKYQTRTTAHLILNIISKSCDTMVYQYQTSTT